MAACTWYGPTGPRGSVTVMRATPSAIRSASQRERSCSSRGTRAPSGRVRAGRRASVSSMRASRPATSGSSGSSRRAWRVRRIASAVRSTRTSSSPEEAAYPSLNTRYRTWSTAATRASRSSGGGRAKVAPSAAIVALARLIRWPTVASGTRKALATSAVVRPPTTRRVSATCDCGDSAGWQHRNSRVSESSCSPGPSPAATRASGPAATASDSSRRRRALRLRSSSVSRRPATVTSQPRGLAGSPSRGHWVAAASRASCTASSQASNRP